MGRLTACSSRRHAAALRTAAATSAAALALVAAGCGRAPAPRVRLVDGTVPTRLPAALHDRVGQATYTRVAVLAARQLDAAGRRCLASFRSEFRIPPATTVVRRTGVVGESLTFRDAGGDVLLGCDGTARGTRLTLGWCGRSVGRLVAGRLRDMRLDIACRSEDGSSVGFGWIEPAPATRWLAVGTGRSTEVEEVAAGLPVRVPTDDVDQATSSATFPVVEYTSRGRIRRRYRLRAGVAG
jgi:hypothetical protein